jgi:hypothetical protein
VDESRLLGLLRVLSGNADASEGIQCRVSVCGRVCMALRRGATGVRERVGCLVEALLFVALCGIVVRGGAVAFGSRLGSGDGYFGAGVRELGLGYCVGVSGGGWAMGVGGRSDRLCA